MKPGIRVRRLLLAVISGGLLAAAYAGCIYSWPPPPAETHTGSGGTGGGAASTSSTGGAVSTSSTGGAASSSSTGGAVDAGGDGAIPGLVAYWSFDDDGGPIAIDQTGHGHDGLLSDGASRVPAGYIGAGVALDRAGGEVRVPSLEDGGFPAEQGTFVMWVKADYTAPSFDQYLFSKYAAPVDAGPDADVTPSKLAIYGGAKDAGPFVYFLFVHGKDGTPWWGPPPVPVLNSQWYRVAAGWDLRGVDGGRHAFKAVNDDYQQTDVSASASLDGQDFRLGHALGGTIDEVALFDHMLTLTELQALP